MAVLQQLLLGGLTLWQLFVALLGWLRHNVLRRSRKSGVIELALLVGVQIAVLVYWPCRTFACLNVTDATGGLRVEMMGQLLAHLVFINGGVDWGGTEALFAFTGCFAPLQVPLSLRTLRCIRDVFCSNIQRLGAGKAFVRNECSAPLLLGCLRGHVRRDAGDVAEL